MVAGVSRTAGDDDEPAGAPPPTALTLEVVHSPDPALVGRRLRVEDGAVIGRQGGDDLALGLGDDRVSRRHAAMQVTADVARVRDLGSRNGTFVDGERVEHGALAPGRVVRIGHTIFVCDEAESAPAPRLPGWVGGSAASRRLAAAIAAVAPTELPVLLVGETGAGKEVAARALHALSRRRGPFVAVNCSALPRELAESMLFGHTRGAYTGATEAGVGLLQRAAGGTLLLDEIGDLPLEQQPKLLRVLENRELLPVGSTVPIAFEARVVAATNADLSWARAEGRFRMDLLSRVAGSTIEIPPLRRRRLDIVPLARHFEGAGGATPRPWSARFVESLLLRPWPMNVRQLRHAVQRLEVHGEEAQLELTDPAASAEHPAVPPRGRPAREELEAALAEARGNVSMVAVRFARAAKQIYRWLEHYGIDPGRYRG